MFLPLWVRVRVELRTVQPVALVKYRAGMIINGWMEIISIEALEGITFGI